MKFEITETEKYKSFVKNEQSLIELAKVEVLQKIAEQLEELKCATQTIAEMLQQHWSK